MKKFYIIVSFVCILICFVACSNIEFVNVDGNLWYDGIEYEPIGYTNGSEALIPLNYGNSMGSAFAHIKKDEYGVGGSVYRIANQSRDEWIYCTMDWMNGESIYKAVSIEAPTLSTFGINQIRLGEANSNSIIISDPSAINELVETLSDAPYLENGSYESFYAKHEFSIEQSVYLLSPNYPGLAFRYKFMRDEQNTNYLSPMRGSDIYIIGTIFDPYIQ